MHEGGRDEPVEGVRHSPGPPVSERAALLDACREVAAEHLAGMLADLFAALIQRLEKGGEGAADDGFLGGLRAIVAARATLEAGVQAALLDGFRELTGSEAAGDVALPEELSLVDEQELEESLAVDDLIAKLHDHFHDALFALEQRFAYLLPQVAVSGEHIPLGPEHLCHAFRRALLRLELDLGTRLYLYKVFDRVLMERLAALYDEINQLLVAHGILPRLRIRVKKQAEETPREMPQQDAAAAPAATVSAPIQAQMFKALQYLLNAQFDHSRHEAEGETAPAQVVAATPLLVDTLSELQQSLSGQEPALAGIPLREQVRQRFGHEASGAQGARINQIDDETIDVISMIFDYILDDKSLPDFIKALIARLQIPVLKVAILDREFFSRKSHPARQLLNDLAYAGVGWLDESEAAKDRLYEKMEAIVHRILHEFDSDIAIFETLLTEFRAFVEEEKKNFLAAQEAVRQRNLQREACKKRIAALLAERLQAHPVPGEVAEFLMGSWRHVVTEISLREGHDGPEAQKAMQVMEDLIWSFSPQARGEERRKLLLILPLMLEALREGLQGIGRSAEEIEAVLEMLGGYHAQVLAPEPAAAQGEAGPAAAPQSPATGGDDIDQMIRRMNADIEALPELEGEDVDITAELMGEAARSGNGSFDRIMAEMGLQQEEDTGPRIEDRYTALVRELALGTWVELEEADRKIRVKLAWKGDEFTNYSFMNRQYKVVAERPLYVLAEDFRQGRAALIEDVALFDRALDGVISGIMKFKGP